MSCKMNEAECCKNIFVKWKTSDVNSVSTSSIKYDTVNNEYEFEVRIREYYMSEYSDSYFKYCSKKYNMEKVKGAIVKLYFDNISKEYVLKVKSECFCKIYKVYDRLIGPIVHNISQLYEFVEY